MSTRVLIGLFSLSLAACAARTATYGGGAASMSGSPPPLAAGATTPKWDHYCALLSGGRGGEEQLNQMLDDASNAGWEMAGVSTMEFGVMMCFKRPRPVAVYDGPPAAAP